MSIIIATFYHFVELINYHVLKNEIKMICDCMNLKGTILLAAEGINGTISGRRHEIDKVFDFLHSYPQLANLTWQESQATDHTFSKMKVRLKKEIVTLGMSDLNISLKGQHIDAESWDDFIHSAKVILIDTRNCYEVALGKFKNAINPNILNFRAFPQWCNSCTIHKDLTIAMYCTGGIRCEKSTAYMLTLGFKNVFYLKGGIISYLKNTHNKYGNWTGECFVFDDRIAIDHSLNPSNKIRCTICSNVVSSNEMKSVTRAKAICFNCKSST
ncbi:oxygen-dependent tRNA uridine(34) hydroxylase TrhO [Wolbachia endosymbiont of Howardula sp.]|uniref:oxygen-dependent tRNA uridine(34) hydroxylase TrhO n=1 Tax=Wolbachia endosymbiont of Howardula sp. TaxID=2916816 RepID=UPI00217D8B36|nr:rhodanese-like domain-containing protein [Wolbachia endosymbiont of Howardula sp.]UWI83349.1 hypothetical protein MC061_01110 [Wolbachia endosymbiont of Howardula sp.]